MVEMFKTVEIETRKLKTDGKNPNRLKKNKFEALKKNIKKYGFIVPIITNNNFLVADGEHRLKAAKELGLKRVSVIKLDVDEVDRRILRLFL